MSEMNSRCQTKLLMSVRCILVRGCRAGNQGYIVLYQASRVCRVNGRNASLPVMSQ